jgi:hypothetical protein
LKRWQTSAVQKICFPFLRMRGARLQSLRFRYEKAGLTVADEPIPWNAEAVLVEAWIRFPPGMTLRKNDLQLLTPDRVPRPATTLHADAEEGIVRAVFRLPPIQGPTKATVQYQGNPLGQVLLPYLAADVFLRDLSLRSPTLFALLGNYNVACQTLVEDQCRGLSAGGILASPTSLLPLSDFNLRVEIADRRTGRTQSASVPFTGSQLVGKEASLSVILPTWPQGVGTCSTRWILGDRLLAHAEVRVISQSAFQQSLYLGEGRFLSQGKEGAALFRHHLLARDDTKGLRPCFLIASREPGMAGACTLEVRVQFRDPNLRPLLCKHEMLVTDRASLCIPNLTTVGDFQQIRAFELLSKGQLLGALPVRPTPAAGFNSEGGFHSAADYDWTPFTEEELLDRLERLMEAGEQERGMWSHAQAG